MRLAKLFVSLLLVHLGHGGGNFKDTRFEITFDSAVYVCTDGKSAQYMETNDVDVIRINETTAMLNGSFRLLKGIDDTVAIALELQQETTAGRYETTFSELICNFCAAKDEVQAYDGYLTPINFPDKCPIPAAEYQVNHLVPDMMNIEPNPGNSGKYKALLKFLKSMDETCKEVEFLGCIVLSLSIGPVY